MAMSRSKINATGRSREKIRYVRLDHYLLRSAAWGSLTPNAKAQFIDVWQRHNGHNNGQIIYAVREAKEAIGLNRDAASKALNELIDRGFLKVSRNASFTTKNREARTWTITAEPIGDKPATKDFMRWTNPDPQSDISDCGSSRKSRTQSAMPDAQSGGTDCDPHVSNEITSDGQSSLTVKAEFNLSQSAMPDTSKLPCFPSGSSWHAEGPKTDLATRRVYADRRRP